MLELSRDRADGAHPYFVPVEHTALSREILGADKLLVPEVAIVVEADPVRARAVAREHVSRYLELPNYVNNLRRLGFSDEDVSGTGSDRLVDAIVGWGDLGAVAARVAAHVDAGADHVLLQPLASLQSALDQLAQLAPVVLAR
jgi:probable F420-dependent oxidoreductase